MNKSMTLEEFFELGHVFSGGEEAGGEGGDGGGDGGDGGGDGGSAVSVVTADGSFTENWSEKYGADNQAHLSRYKDFDSLVNSTISTKKKFGKNPDSLVEIPSETSSDDVRAAFRKAKGVPDNLDAYEYKLSDEMAIKLGPLQDDKMSAIRKFAQEELELSPGKFTKLLDFYHQSTSDDIDAFGISNNEQLQKAQEEGKAQLRTLPGWQSEQEYTDKVRIAQSVMEKYDLVGAIDELALQNSPKLLVGLNNIADSMSEDTLKGLRASPDNMVANTKTQIAEIRSRMDVIIKENPSNFKGNVEFKDLQKYKQAHGTFLSLIRSRYSIPTLLQFGLRK